MKKIATLLLAIVLVAGVFTACGGNGDSGSGDSGSAISVISREEGSGTRGAFTELMGIAVDDVDNTTQTAEVSQSTSVVLTTVAGNEKAIGYVSLGSLNDTVKAVKVDGVDATVENIKGGSYAVSRPFNIVTGKAFDDLSQDFVDFIMSAQGQQIISDEGYISIDENAPTYDNNTVLEGTLVVAGSTSVAPVMQVLADAYKEIHSDVKIEIQQTGSGAGITSTIEGACQIGMSSRALKEEELSQGIEEKTIAMDGIAVIVNKANTVDSLSSEQIRQIFTGEVTTWEEVQ